MTIKIEVRGIEDTINFVKNIRAEFPKASRAASRQIAREIQKRARMNLDMKTFKDTSTGELSRAITIRPRRLRGKIISHVVGPDLRVVPYAEIIESGRTGIHAVPIRRFGEIAGFYTAPGGMLPSTGGRFYMRDAFFDVFGRARGIALKEYNKRFARFRR